MIRVITFGKNFNSILHNYMSVIIITALISLLIACVFLVGLLWSVKDGQYDDEFSSANRILFDNTTENQNNK
jgi:cbb3-type cytochrome oxidase maturation protein